VKISEAIDQLKAILKMRGDLEIDVLTETPEAQTEQPLGEICTSGNSSIERRVKLLPVGFT
jgi:hypothetical protein